MALAVRARLRKPRLGELLDALALQIFGKWATALARSLELRDMLEKAGILVDPVVYAARMLLYTTAMAFVAAISMVIVALLPVGLVFKVLGLLALAFLPIGIFMSFMMRVMNRVQARKRGTEEELPYLALYMSVMALGGVSPMAVFERIARSRVFRAIRDEAARIIRNIKVFGLDPLSALERNARTHPSRAYKNFIFGYTTTVRVGGDVAHYLIVQTREIIKRKAGELETVVNRVSVFVEMYISVAVIATLTLYAFFIVGSYFKSIGMTGPASGIFLLYGYVFLPLFNLMAIFLVHKSLPETSRPIKLPYLYIPVTLIPALIAVVAILYSLGAIHSLLTLHLTIRSIVYAEAAIAAVLIPSSLGPAVMFYKIMRREKKLPRKLADFLHDVAEARKTGLSPEKSIIVAALGRNYGALDPIVKKIATALNLGLSLEAAVRRALHRIYDKLTIIAMRILVDSIEAGGGTAELLDLLAQHADALADLQEELKRKLKTYIAMPYLGTLVLAISGILLLSMMLQATHVALPTSAGAAATAAAGMLKPPNPQQVLMLTLITVTSITIHAYLSGLLAGKLSTGFIAGGFLHAAIQVLIVALIEIIGYQTMLVPALQALMKTAAAAPP
ncbi:MAG: hypothetical protein GXO09_02595 [Crenarchaeota archaeon]|nr:hypothetical protein [Thermoproteota archaeon]